MADCITRQRAVEALNLQAVAFPLEKTQSKEPPHVPIVDQLVQSFCDDENDFDSINLLIYYMAIEYSEFTLADFITCIGIDQRLNDEQKYGVITGLIDCHDKVSQKVNQMSAEPITNVAAQFTQVLLHDLRTEVGAVETALGLINAIIEGKQYEEETLEVVKVLIQNFISTYDMLEAISTGRSKAESVNISEFIYEEIARLNARSRIRDEVEVQVTIPEDISYVSVDKAILSYIMLHLYSNAITYCDTDKPTISVEINMTDAALALRITNTSSKPIREINSVELSDEEIESRLIGKHRGLQSYKIGLALLVRLIRRHNYPIRFHNEGSITSGIGTKQETEISGCPTAEVLIPATKIEELHL